MFDTFSGNCHLSESAVMRQVFPISLVVFCVASTGASAPAEAGPIRGTVTRAAVSVTHDSSGYVRTQVARPAAKIASLRADVSLFLKVKESLPIPTPTRHQSIRISGLRLVPDIATCAVDAQVTFHNDDAEPMTVEIGGKQLNVAPGQSQAYECTAGEKGGDEQREVRIKEWPHIRGSVFVGEVGVVAALDASGDFTMEAPKGQYELLIVNRNGVVVKRDIEVGPRVVDLGTIELGTAAGDP